MDIKQRGTGLSLVECESVRSRRDLVSLRERTITAAGKQQTQDTSAAGSPACSPLKKKNLIKN